MLPNCYILGAQKAGTSWIHKLLQHHPEVNVGSRKEIHFFDTRRNFERGQAWYEEQFAGKTSPIVCDSTPNYFQLVLDPDSVRHKWYPVRAADNLKSMTPDARFIISLRDPVSRAVSAYFHNIRHGRISHKIPFTEALHQRDLIEPGMYWEQLSRWFEMFPREHFLILIYEIDLIDPVARLNTSARITSHLGIGSDYEELPINVHVNSRLPSIDMRAMHWPNSLQALTKRLPRAVRNSNLWEFKIPDSELSLLRAVYKNSNLKLANELDMNIPWQ